MKTIAYLLITVGFLAGALVSVTDTLEVNWTYFAGAVVIGIVGITLIKQEEKKAARADHVILAGMNDLETSLTRLTETVRQLNSDKASIHTYDIHGRIDETCAADMGRFAEARKSMIPIFGLQGYADVMSHFAAAERYLNRVWSASADGYVDEVNAYLERAANQFGEAEAEFLKRKDTAR